MPGADLIILMKTVQQLGLLKLRQIITEDNVGVYVVYSCLSDVNIGCANDNVCPRIYIKIIMLYSI